MIDMSAPAPRFPGALSEQQIEALCELLLLARSVCQGYKDVVPSVSDMDDTKIAALIRLKPEEIIATIKRTQIDSIWVDAYNFYQSISSLARIRSALI